MKTLGTPGFQVSYGPVKELFIHKDQADEAQKTFVNAGFDTLIDSGRFFTDDELVQLLMDFHNYLTYENHKLPGSHVLFSMYLESRGFE